MASENAIFISPAEITSLMQLCAKIRQADASGHTENIPDEVVSALLSTATMLYARATHEDGRAIAPFVDRGISATSVVVTVKAMLQAAGLSSFDLAMWSNRVPSRE